MEQSEHQEIKPLSCMIGKWLAKKATGQYPTIKNFDFQELLEISHPAPNQPCLHFKFSSWFENEKHEKQFAHFEYGILKVKPKTSPLFLVYTSSHNNGLAIIEEGVFNEKNKLIHLKSKSVSRTSINQLPALEEIQREIKLIDEKNISIKTFMSTSSHNILEEHLFVEYEKTE